MAEVTKTTREITTTAETFTLTLSAEEFAWLKDLIGAQPASGISRDIWEAMKAPTDAQDQTFGQYDSVTVLPGAVSEAGSALGFEGPAEVLSGPDFEGDYFVRSSNGNDHGYVLPRYLRKR
ncbi:hypothetical protein [Streptomyces sp. bgisy032]|uniref:hypothetical protein n=1 Tax=Streptomyces sp. bgisy032 TaxID=3413773 RepID=UPI003D74559A